MMSRFSVKGLMIGLVLAATSLAILAGEARAEKRFFVVAAVEPKGGVTVDKEPFPGEALPEGRGYELKEPDANGRWQVSTYLWAPAQIVVNEGDEVTIEFVGINGASHPTTIEGLGKEFVLKRGTVARVGFTADKAGVFPIVCSTHRPSMTGEIVVLPRR